MRPSSRPQWAEKSPNHMLPAESRPFSRVSSIVSPQAAALQESGFINYFGLQRFGTGSIATHSVGAELLKGNWAEATGLILRPREDERDDCNAARQYYAQTGDAKGTLNMIPGYMVAEKALLEGMRDNKGHLG